MANDKAFVLNYHAEAAEDSFWKWAYISMVAPLRESAFAELRELTKDGSECVITAQVNGVEVSVNALFLSLFSNYEHSVKNGVAQAIEEAQLEQLQEVLHDTELAVTAFLRERFAAVGVVVPDRKDD